MKYLLTLQTLQTTYQAVYITPIISFFTVNIIPTIIQLDEATHFFGYGVYYITKLPRDGLLLYRGILEINRIGNQERNFKECINFILLLL